MSHLIEKNKLLTRLILHLFHHLFSNISHKLIIPKSKIKDINIFFCLYQKLIKSI
jgi:hypothetical protein